MRTPYADRGLPDDIGARLRVAREDQGISVRGLARTIGVSSSLISQIERGQQRPTAKRLDAILGALGLTLEHLTATDPLRLGESDRAAELARLFGSQEMFSVQRGDDRRQIRLATGVTWERLTPAPDSFIDFMHVRYEPGGANMSDGTMHRHGGREYGVILSGRLRVRLGFEVVDLEAGDSIVFDALTPHLLENPGDEPVEAIWAVLGRGPSVVDGEAAT